MTPDTASDLSYAGTLWKAEDALRGQFEMLEPYADRVYDSIFGQESTSPSWWLAHMNLTMQRTKSENNLSLRCN